MGDIIISIRTDTEWVCSVFSGKSWTYRTDEAKRYKTIREAQRDIVEGKLKNRLRKEYGGIYSYDLAICRGEWDENGELVKGTVLKRWNYGN